MPALMALVLTMTAAAAPPAVELPGTRVESMFIRVAPRGGQAGRSPEQTRAVVLIHGLSLFTRQPDKGGKVPLRSWQEPDSHLVKQLADYADVYSLAYAQSVPVEKVHEGVDLRGRIRALKKDGYKEIVLVGHSAGGLIARHFVEDYPDAGVTKVVQVCAPNAGSALAGLKLSRETNVTFLSSMSRTARLAVLAKRKEVLIPERVEFACVVASLRLSSDGVVAFSSQWSADLQKQNVPAHVIRAAHWDAVRTSSGAQAIAKIIRQSHPRWKDDEVKQAKKKLLGG